MSAPYKEANKGVVKITGTGDYSYSIPEISDAEFKKFQLLIYDLAGISLSNEKKTLVSGRLLKRLRENNLTSFSAYFDLITNSKNSDEFQIAIDALTTNETHFFREPKHFDFLKTLAVQHKATSRPFYVWSAASSSGEEPYSIAMVLAEVLGDAAWEVTGSDLSSRVLKNAQRGHYALESAKNIPSGLLEKYCLRGIGKQTGTLLIHEKIRARVNFKHINLNNTLPQLPTFDVVFLRNVMIYFNQGTKRAVVDRILPTLRHGGHLIIGHAESLHGVNSDLQLIKSSIYRKN